MTARTAFSTTAARVVAGDKLALGGTVVEVSKERLNGQVSYRIRTQQRRGFGQFADDLMSSLDYYTPAHRLDLSQR